MERDFWQSSAASLQEKVVAPPEKKQKTPGKKIKVRKGKSQRKMTGKAVKKDAFLPLRQLENAYGKYVFGTKGDRFTIQVSRKSEYKEETFSQCRETLNEQRLHEKKTSGARVFSDSHKKEESAVILEETRTKPSAERMFQDLKNAVEKGNRLTLKEMMPQRAEVEKKVFQNLKASVEALRQREAPLEEIPFWRRGDVWAKHKEEPQNTDGKDNSPAEEGQPTADENQPTKGPFSEEL